MPRIVEPEHLPASLWDPAHPASESATAGCLHLPPHFAQAYVEILTETGLVDRAREPETETEGGATGGLDDGGFSEHFARRFAGSAARVQLYALDPRNDFSTTSDALFTLFAGGSVRLLDIPVGTGAASALLLSVISEMRQQQILSRNPTRVAVVGGDIDRNALGIASRVYEKLRPSWINAGLDAALKCREWDIASDESTGDLVDEWSKPCTSSDRCGIVIANFSGFLASYVEASQKRQIEEVDFSIRHILLSATKVGAPIFWIEPARTPVSKMFSWFETNIGSKFKRLGPAFIGSRRSIATTRSPVVNTATFTTRSSGIHWRPTPK